MDHVTLQFSTSTAWQSGVIRALTKSAFSHVDLVIPAGVQGAPAPYGLLGASDPGGVIIRVPNYHDFLRRRRMKLYTIKAGEILNLAFTQLGKPFDHDALSRVFDFNWREDWRDDGKWYCAELIAWILERVDLWYQRRFPVKLDLVHVTPEDLIKYLAGEYDPDEFAKEVVGV